MKKNINTIIEITDAHVKFLQFKEFTDQPAITFFNVKEIRDYTDDEIISILRDMIKSKHAQAETLALVIPRKFTILKYMMLPSQNQDEIKKMVELQLVNTIPYALEDISYHHYLIEKDKSGSSQVLVIVIHKDVSSRYLNIFDKVGIGLHQIVLSSFGLLEWLEHQRRKKEIQENEPIAVVDLDVGQSEICFCHNGKILFSRSFDGGAKDLTKDHIFHLVKQIDLSIKAYKKEDIASSIKEIILVSTQEERKLLKENLEHELNIATRHLMPMENILHDEDVINDAIANFPGISVTVGLGLGLSNIKKIINLIPEEVHETKQEEKLKHQWFKFGFLLLLASVLFISVPGLKLYEKMSYLKELENELEQIKPLEKRARQQVKFIQSFNKEFGKRVFISDVLYELYELVPPEITFRSLHLNEKGLLTIEGYAQIGKSINAFQEALLRSPLFKDVNLQFATKRKIFKTEVINFKINTRLTVTEDKDND